jgi:hypothetical protein
MGHQFAQRAARACLERAKDSPRHETRCLGHWPGKGLRQGWHTDAGTRILARVAAGKPVVKPSLPRRALGQSDLVQVGTQGNRQAVGEEAMAVPPEPFFDEPVEAVRARAEALLLRCRVPKGLQAPHRLVAELLDEDTALRKAIEKDRIT